VKSVILPGATVLAMVKPQFEVGAKFLKKGVVRSEEIQKSAVRAVADFAVSIGFEVRGESAAAIKGPKGNQEYFLWLVRY
jgi:23S rRNA (cytidine1920-2'-O)/16S rRNA (cytidine1409-2'-O)-methyltransferase